MTLKILGIDPGRSGGAVLLEDARTVLRVHKFVEEDDFVSFIEEMKDMEVDAAYIEQVGGLCQIKGWPLPSNLETILVLSAAWFGVRGFPCIVFAHKNGRKGLGYPELPLKLPTKMR